MPDWDAIVELHGQLVWRTVYRSRRQPEDAGDCFQDTFLSALAASRRQPIENWGGFLRRVATARALDRLRQRAPPDRPRRTSRRRIELCLAPRLAHSDRPSSRR